MCWRSLFYSRHCVLSGRTAGRCRWLFGSFGSSGRTFCWWARMFLSAVTLCCLIVPGFRLRVWCLRTLPALHLSMRDNAAVTCRAWAPSSPGRRSLFGLGRSNNMRRGATPVRARLSASARLLSSRHMLRLSTFGCPLLSCCAVCGCLAANARRTSAAGSACSSEVSPERGGLSGGGSWLPCQHSRLHPASATGMHCFTFYILPPLFLPALLCMFCTFLLRIRIRVWAAFTLQHVHATGVARRYRCCRFQGGLPCTLPLLLPHAAGNGSSAGFHPAPSLLFPGSDLLYALGRTAWRLLADAAVRLGTGSPAVALVYARRRGGDGLVFLPPPAHHRPRSFQLRLRRCLPRRFS